MTQGQTIELDGATLDQLAMCLGLDWTERLLDDDTRTGAVAQLCQGITQLVNVEHGMHLHLLRTYRNGLDEAIERAVKPLDLDARVRTETVEAIADAIAAVVVSDSALPQKFDHHGRDDNNGCICGYSGHDLLTHLLEARRRNYIISIASHDIVADELGRYLRELMNDPTWAAQYWSARSHADDDVGMCFEHLRALGATVQLENDGCRVTFSGAGGVDRQSIAAGTGTAAFPIAVDQYDWSRPPGRLLKTWADSVGLDTEDVARACNLAPEIFHGVVTGSELITTDIARQLEAGTNTLPANVWLMLERQYRAALVERAQQPHH